MLYLFYGTDHKKVRSKAHAFIDALRAKKPDAHVVHIDEENYSPEVIKEYISSQGLFSREIIVVFNKLFDSKDRERDIEGIMKEINKSSNVFIIVEETIRAAFLKKLEKYSQKIWQYTKKELDIVDFSPFPLTGSLGRRDRKEAWVLYQQAIKEGVSVEQLHGIIFWQVKTIALVKKTSTDVKLSLKPFVFKKAKTFAEKYSMKELNALLSALVDMYHCARMGKVDLKIELEKLIITL